MSFRYGDDGDGYALAWNCGMSSLNHVKGNENATR